MFWLLAVNCQKDAKWTQSDVLLTEALVWNLLISGINEKQKNKKIPVTANLLFSKVLFVTKEPIRWVTLKKIKEIKKPTKKVMEFDG